MSAASDGGSYDIGALLLYRLSLRLAFQERDLFDPRGIGRTPGRDIGVVFEGVVNDAPLIGVHRLELQRAPGDAYSLSQLANALHDSIFAHGTIMLAINNDLLGIFVFRLQQPVEKKLNGVEHFSVTANQTPAFLGVNLQGQISAFALHFRNFHHEAEVAEHGIE
jgi:hypothetical protein